MRLEKEASVFPPMTAVASEGQSDATNDFDDSDEWVVAKFVRLTCLGKHLARPRDRKIHFKHRWPTSL